MQLLKVIMRNFQSFREATVLLKDRGLVSIEGKTLDKDGASSNGSGKSTLINAILWCNYGDSGKDIDSVDEVVSFGSKGGTTVECHWLDEITGATYVVARYRKHTKFKNSLTVYTLDGDGITDITKGTNPQTQELINEILGADQSTFEASCLAKQDSAPDIPGMTDGELKLLLEKVLPFEDLGTLYKKACKNRDDQLALVTATEREIERNEVRLTGLVFSMNQTTQDMNGWDAQVEEQKASGREDIARYQHEIDTITASLKPQDKIDAAIAKYKSLIEGYDDRPRQRYLGEAARLERNIVEAQLAVNNLSDKCHTCQRPYQNYEESMEVATWTLTNARAAKTVHDMDASVYADAFSLDFENRTKLERLLMANRTQERQLNNLRRAEEHRDRLQAQVDANPANPHIGAMEALQVRSKAIVDESNVLEEKLVDQKARLEVLQAVADTYSPKGVRYHILDEVTPELNNRTNYYLSQLTDGKMKAIWSTVTKLKTGDFKEKFSIAVSGDGFGSYGSLSGGEKRKVRLACFFALQDLIASRATKDIKLWCGDEIDHALDPAGMERLMSLLHEKVKSKETILVISHNELRDWIPNFTTVVKEGRASTITGYLSE